LMYDPQTSGGLLIAMPEDDVAKMLAAYPLARRIGSVIEKGERLIELL